MIRFDRLRNVALALNEYPVEASTFTMRKWGHDCGTPACAFGHYAAREDLQDEFALGRGCLYLRTAGGRLDALSVSRAMEEIARHFGLTLNTAESIFGEFGCAGAQTRAEAAAFIESFVQRCAPSPRPDGDQQRAPQHDNTELFSFGFLARDFHEPTVTELLVRWLAREDDTALCLAAMELCRLIEPGSECTTLLGMLLVRPKLRRSVARVFACGEKKYGRGNYRLGAPLTQYVSHAIEHMAEWCVTAGNDSESGEPHTVHALINILMALDQPAWRDDRLTAVRKDEVPF